MLIEQMVKSGFGLQLPGYQLDNSTSRLIGKIIWLKWKSRPALRGDIVWFWTESPTGKVCVILFF